MYQFGYNEFGSSPYLGDFIFSGVKLLRDLLFGDTGISDRVGEQLGCGRDCRVEGGSLVHDRFSGRNALNVSAKRLDNLLDILA